MKIPALHHSLAGIRDRRPAEPAQTLSVASRMAMISPAGVDVWVQREMASFVDAGRVPTRPRV